MPPSNHSIKTVPNSLVCPWHEIEEGHHREPNRYCRKLGHGTCESRRFLLRCFHTNSNLPSAQGPLQHGKMRQLAIIHARPDHSFTFVGKLDMKYSISKIICLENPFHPWIYDKVIILCRSFSESVWANDYCLKNQNCHGKRLGS